MVEVEESQVGVELGQAERVLKDIRIAGESSPLQQIEVVPREDLKLTEQAAYERGKKDAEATLQSQLEVMKTEYATEQQQKLADFFKNIQDDLGGQVPRMLQSLEKHVINLAADIAMKIVAGTPVDKSMVETVVKDALAKAEKDTDVVVLLNEADLELLSQADSELLQRTHGSSEVVFKASPEVSRGGCLLETRYGTVDARIETKADVLKKAVTT
ncbi:MAG: FliH/SctL family protein [Limisphaerales bacterium]|jgi:flagellar assembly protein FliH|tara:strand:+ start:770 stop:1414 length:645 start_codon:yes stop_codon:yes gene_type:complete